MPFLLDRLNKLNYAGQIQRQALAQLVAGRLQPGDRLPSVRGLARDLHISRTTAERIQDVLCETLFAEIRPRSGAYVALPEDQSWSDGRKRAQALYARSSSRRSSKRAAWISTRRG
jgi:DNA-binding transcriptional regulator YhcF (GntR family)